MSDTNDEALRESHHRCANDLQLIVAMLQLKARRIESQDGRDALLETANRVQVLAAARADLCSPKVLPLDSMLRCVCEALQVLADPRDVVISLQVDTPVPQVAAAKILAIGIAVNELGTNAIKHAFAGRSGGRVDVSLVWNGARSATVTVCDDGGPFPQDKGERARRGAALGLRLAERTLDAKECLLIHPEDGSKEFTIRIPVKADQVPN